MCLHLSDRKAFLEAVSLADDAVFYGRRQRYLVENAADAMVTTFDPCRLLDGIKIEASWGPELAPLFEANFQEVAVDGLGTVDADHTIDEAAASSILAGAVEVAGRIACGPCALGAVFAPGQNRSGYDLTLKVCKRSDSSEWDLFQ